MAMFGSGICDETAPFGLEGGKPAPKTRQYLKKVNGKIEWLDVNCLLRVEKGDVIEIFSSGGGGFGSPYYRSAEKVLEDVKNGLISIENAKKEYGVVIDADSSGINWVATKELRNSC